MSLKAFHIIFITAACAMSLGCGVWALVNYAGPDGRPVHLWSGLGAVAVSIGLIVYECYFLKKTKNVSYL
jgi:hypothetical protein